MRGTRLIDYLDRFLPKDLKRAPPDELARFRVLAGAALSLLGVTVAFVVAAVLASMPWSFAVIGLFTLTGYLASLLSLRKASSPRPPALALCVTMAFGIGAGALFQDDPYASTHVGSMFLTILAVYLLGPRLGLVIVVPYALFVGIGHPLSHVHFGSGPRPFDRGHYWVMHIFAGAILLAGWAVGWLYSSARDRVHAALEQVLRTLRESESKLVSLIESTDDLVCSIDKDERLLIANSALKRLLTSRLGHEPVIGSPFLAGMPPETQERWRERFARALAGESARYEEEEQLPEGARFLDISINPIREAGGEAVGLTLFARDITAQKTAETQLGDLHRTLLDVSRQAGMAEIATGVLHNVGNTLNSVNVSATLLNDQLLKSRVSGLGKAMALLGEHADDLGTFLDKDPKGRQIVAYLKALSTELEEERGSLLAEVRSLTDSVEHMKAIVSMQQQHARFSGVLEQVQVPKLIEDALRLDAETLDRLGIEVERQYNEVPPIVVDRHRLLQILHNLLTNARHALLEANRPDKRISIRVLKGESGSRLRIEVVDNGVGIPPELLPRLFSQGFTTKKTGHGFGLHISSLAATEMEGRLSCTSPGPALGATFILDLPLEPAAARAAAPAG
jgi:two-component system sensor kinase FixL